MGSTAKSTATVAVGVIMVISGLITSDGAGTIVCGA
ncbi:hypothetical protein QF050_001725 [Arthrobacter sp. SLBN-112]|nr:hypothetical protein [Arthrobacter sp. SLBN-112]